MADTIVTETKEMLDVICRRTYGDESGYVEAVLDANPGLAALGPILPVGTSILLPDIPTAIEVVPVVTLWD
ncbi:P2-like prophage tail protein X [Fulvimarina manganoxydans]|uniref:p2-like prophage tail protein X n=1 Tax=Fulvimarina manganoxydans TaxID=937218 RepID=A0A1W1Z4K3_9HYPH|nr:tail protein X [Fulvimarina manganoxydans]SMC43294.1 P2-like prophage tail protein X [Fulvimarina manganoxydans]